MSAVSSITRQTVGRTFIVAISLLGVAAGAQLGVVIWFFMARFHSAPLAAENPAAITMRRALLPILSREPLARRWEPRRRARAR